jgi:hypothetical protein
VLAFAAVTAPEMVLAILTRESTLSPSERARIDQIVASASADIARMDVTINATTVEAMIAGGAILHAFATDPAVSAQGANFALNLFETVIARLHPMAAT